MLLGPWMAASIGVTITFPMLFVARPGAAAARNRRPASRRPADVDRRRRVELDGAALALTVSTLVMLAVLLVLLSLRVLAESGRRLALSAAAIGALALAPSPCPPRCCPTPQPPSSASRPSRPAHRRARPGPAAGVELAEDARLDSPRAARPREAGARRRRADGVGKNLVNAAVQADPGLKRYPSVERGRVARRLRGSRSSSPRTSSATGSPRSSSTRRRCSTGSRSTRPRPAIAEIGRFKGGTT